MSLFYQLDPEEWRRCTNCTSLLRVTSQEQLRRHIGHRLVYASRLSLMETVKIMAGLL